MQSATGTHDARLDSPVATSPSSPVLGWLAALSGAVAVLGVTLTWLVSTVMDMPGWARIVSGWAFPVGALGAIVLGILAMRLSGRKLAVTGFVLAAVSVVMFVAMILSMPY